MLVTICLCRYVRERTRRQTAACVEVLRCNTFFKTLEQDTLEQLAHVATLQDFVPNTMINNQGDAADDLRVVASGMHSHKRACFRACP